MKHREIAFEDAIELSLIASGGFQKGSAAYDAALALYPDDVLAFVQATQAKTWKALTDLYGPGAGGALIDALVKELASKTALGVLRRAAAAGLPCLLWTVNSPVLIRRYATDPRVAAIITDVAAQAVAIVAGAGAARLIRLSAA